MTRKRITWTITVKHDYINKLLSELAAWGVKKSRYQVNGNTVITQDANVVDVATETFAHRMNLLEIKEAQL